MLSDTEAIERARQMYAAGFDGEIQIDDDAKVASSDGGVFVAAWVWVPNEGDDDADL